MNRLIVAAVVLGLLGMAPLLAERIDYYAIRRSQVIKSEVDSVEARGNKDKQQPIRSTFLLTQLNTDYYLISNPSLNDAFNLTMSGKAVLYQSYIFDDNKVWLDIDNSAQFDVKKDWSVQKGTGPVVAVDQEK